MASNTPRTRPSSAGCSPRPKSSSMLYSMLPSVVQSRLPKLPSLQRSASMYGSMHRPKSAGSSCPSSGSWTPETGYGHTMVWSGAKSEEELYFAESGIEMSEEEDILHMDRRKRPQSVALKESKSGIGWKFANQGMTTSCPPYTRLINFGNQASTSSPSPPRNPLSFPRTQGSAMQGLLDSYISTPWYTSSTGYQPTSQPRSS